MLFRKKIERCCAYCVYGGKVDEESVVCRKKGIVSAEQSCRRFRYDPLKRVPAAPAKQDFSKYDQTDFSL